MERLTLRDIWNFIVASRKKILLAGIIFMVIVIPAVYLLAPVKYNIQTAISIPYDSSKVAEYDILIRRSILAQVCRELNIDASEENMAQMDKQLSIAIDEGGRKIYLSFLGSDAEQVSAIGNGISMRTLEYARDERVAYLEGFIKNSEERIETIDELMDDEFIAEYYEKISQVWRSLLEKGGGAGLNVFLEVDPTIKDLYLEKKNLRSDIRRVTGEISALQKEEDSELEKCYTPIYEPDEKEPPQLLPVILLSAVAGAIFGILWVTVINFGIKKIKRKEFKKQESKL